MLNLRKFNLTIEDDARKAVFLVNLAAINTHNSNPHVSWTMGVTGFAHLTQEEFTDTLVCGYNGREGLDAGTGAGAVDEEAPLHTHVPEGQLPTSVDWRKRKPSVVSVEAVAVRLLLGVQRRWHLAAGGLRPESEPLWRHRRLRRAC